MKKRNLLILVSLFSLSSINLISCDDETISSSDDTIKIQLEGYKEKNYVLDETVTNENGSVSYEIFVRSFKDSDGNGTGDFNGVKEELPYLKDLGVKTLWLMPIHESPTYHGYDVIDYYGVNADYGTMDDFKSLVDTAKTYNIDIMIDMVFNHSSTQNQWFIDSYNDYKSNNTSKGSKKDWYCWSTNGRSGYSYYKNDLNAYYESRFDSSMPDFNTENEEVRAEFIKILKHWVDIGVKGFRFDAVKYFAYETTAYNTEFLSFIADTIKAYDDSIYFVGECWDSINIINDYYKSSFDSFFKFNGSLAGFGNDAILGQVKGINKSNSFGDLIQKQEKTLKENNPNGYSSYFLANHDTDRASHSFNTNEYAKMAASLLMTLPGTPFMYYGEEIMLKGQRETNDHSDARRRLPMIWDKNDKTGECAFPETNRTDLMENTQVTDGVKQQLETDYSVLNHYKKMINIRNKYPFMKESVFTNLTSNINQEHDNVLAYKLSYGDEYVIIIHNFEKVNVEIDVSTFATSIVDEASTSKLIPELVDGKLKIGTMSTVILK